MGVEAWFMGGSNFWRGRPMVKVQNLILIVVFRDLNGKPCVIFTPTKIDHKMSLAFLLPSLAALSSVCVTWGIQAPVAQSVAGEFTIVMEMKSSRNGKADKNGNLEVTLTSVGDLTGMYLEQEGSITQLIFDQGARTMTTINVDKSGDRSGVKMPMLRLPSPDLSAEGITITATKETKRIIGYEARKFLISSKDGSGENWIAEVPGVDWRRIAERVQTGRKGGSPMELPALEGYEHPVTLESIFTSFNDKSVMHMQVRSIIMGSKARLDLLQVPAGVPLVDMSGMLGRG